MSSSSQQQHRRSPNRFARHNSDVLFQIMDFLDVAGIYNWYRAVRTDKTAAHLFSKGIHQQECEWFRTLVMLPSRAVLPEHVPLWYMAMARSVEKVCVHLHGCSYLQSFMQSLCGGDIPLSATSIKLSIWSADLHNNLMPVEEVNRVCEAFIETLTDIEAPRKFARLQHFELHFQSFQEDAPGNNGDGANTPLVSVGHRLLGALFGRCLNLERLEGTSTWPGFASVNALRFLPLGAARDRPPYATALKQLSIFEATPLHGFIDESLELLADVNDATAIFPNPDLDTHDNTLERQFQPFKPDLMPALERVELRFDDAQDAQRLFILWNFLLRDRAAGRDSRQYNNASRAVGAQIRELYLHIDFIDPTKHFEMQHLWNSVLRGIDRRGLPPLLPALEVLNIDSWLLCGQFLDFLCGGRKSSASSSRRRHPLRLTICPGDEDPCTAAFLEHNWCEETLLISHLHLKRRTLSQPGSMYQRYLQTERKLGFDPERAADPRPGETVDVGATFLTAASLLATAPAPAAPSSSASISSSSSTSTSGFYSFFKDEYVADDAFAVHGADYAQARTTVVRAVHAALSVGKMKHTESLGLPAMLLETIGCEADSQFPSSATAVSKASRYIQKQLRQLFSPENCKALHSLTFYVPYPSLPMAQSAGPVGGTARPLVERIARLIEAWGAVMKKDEEEAAAWARGEDLADKSTVSTSQIDSRSSSRSSSSRDGKADPRAASKSGRGARSSGGGRRIGGGVKSGAYHDTYTNSSRSAWSGTEAASEAGDADSEAPPRRTLCRLKELVFDLPLDLAEYLPTLRSLLSPIPAGDDDACAFSRSYGGFRLVDCPLSPSGRDMSVLSVVFKGFRGRTCYFLRP